VASFLDVGCGTGTLLVTLGQAHPTWRLGGIDGSHRMLAEARRKAERAGLAPSLAQVELPGTPAEVVAVGGSFDAAGAFFDTLNHLPDVAALEATFASVAATLVPGGLFAFDLTNAAGFCDWWQGARRWELPAACITVAMRYDARTGHAEAEVRIDGAGGRSQGMLGQRLFPDEEITRAAIAAGFAILENEPWAPFSDGIEGKTWLVVRKQA
jgi:SAM-dependent methyltransferase